MPYDEALAARLRRRLAGKPGIVERKMFGGIGFLLDGNMCVGIHRDALIVRMDPAQAQAALGEPGVRVFDISGRPMKGWLQVDAQALGDGRTLGRWVRRGVEFASGLPPTSAPAG
jgi:TfoX/Sxy family transcriptional regulator of competence genes